MIRFAPGVGGIMAAPSRQLAGERLVNIHPGGFNEHGDRLAELQRSTQALLSSLDELGLHQAAAYVSMGLDAIRRNRDLLPTG